jgi:hypothetical protein
MLFPGVVLASSAGSGYETAGHTWIPVAVAIIIGTAVVFIWVVRLAKRIDRRRNRRAEAETLLERYRSVYWKLFAQLEDCFKYTHLAD